MIQNTLKKLREAQFFLNLLHEKAKTISGKDEEFDFFLSAFLSAGRSVNFVFRQINNEKIRQYYCSWVNELDKKDREIWDFMKGQRNKILKEGNSDTEKNWEYGFIPVVKHEMSEHPAYYGVHWFGPIGSEVNKFGHRESYFNLGRSKVEVIETCTQYLLLLDRFIQDFKTFYPEDCQNESN